MSRKGFWAFQGQPAKRQRSSADSHFGAEREMEISLEGSYRKDPPLRLNKFGLPEKSRYRTADVCALLGISPDLLRWRFLTGKYSEARRDGRGRVFNVEDLESILAQNKKLGKGRESPKQENNLKFHGSLSHRLDQ